MKDDFSISEAAKMANMTSETLRHYDRIGLVNPSRRDKHTGYRYYSRQDIIRLNTIQALRYMDLSLAEIQRILQLDRLQEVVHFFKQAEKRADEKIAKLYHAKEKIRRARMDYEKKIAGQLEQKDVFPQYFPERVILLSDTMQYPTLDNLWQYHRHFYQQLKADERDLFAFEDLAGIYTQGGHSQLFAVCIQYPSTQGLTILPAGTYLCANCSQQNKEQCLAHLVQLAQERYGATIEFTVQIVVVSAILQWDYQIQILVAP